MDIKNIREQLIAMVSRRLEGTREISDEQVRQTAQEVLTQLLAGEYLSVNDRRELVSGVLNQMKKLGPLQPILDDKNITEIMINGPDNIFVEQSGRLRKLDLRFESRRQRIVSRVNRTVDTSNPICDARLEDGSRVNVVLNPIALDGPVVTIRKFPEKVLQFSDLISWKAITPEAAEFLQAAVRAKYNIFVSGGTGSGKTTFLNALSSFIPPDERIITIEDSAELQIRTIPNLVRLETRNANTEGKGEVTIRDLIRSSLRMRP